MTRTTSTVPADLAAYRRALAEARRKIADHAHKLSWPRREAAEDCRRIVADLLFEALKARELKPEGKP